MPTGLEPVPITFELPPKEASYHTETLKYLNVLGFHPEQAEFTLRAVVSYADEDGGLKLRAFLTSLPLMNNFDGLCTMVLLTDICNIALNSAWYNELQCALLHPKGDDFSRGVSIRILSS